jgi:hypothetical protein
MTTIRRGSHAILFTFVLAVALGAIPRAASAQTGSISGSVTAAGSSTGLGGLRVYVYNASGTFVAFASTDTDGSYTVADLAPATYFARTFAFQDAANYLDQLYNAMLCEPSCSVTSGTPIVVTAGNDTGGVDFALSPGGSFTGRVTSAATSANLAGVQVTFYGSTGTFINSVVTEADGTFAVIGLQTGTYFARTFVGAGVNYVDQLYSGNTCIPSCLPIGGTPIDVVAGGAAIGNIDFALAGGGSMTGHVSDAGTLGNIPGATITVYGSNGAFAKSAVSAGDGTFVVAGLPTGSYYAFASATNYIDQGFSGVQCAPCSLNSGTPIAITVGATTGNIDFALAMGGSLTGRVTAAGSGVNLASVSVSVYSQGGVAVKTATSGADGTYTVTGLPAGNYYARTFVNSENYADQLYNGLPCTACNVTSGTLIVVTAGATTGNINFALNPGGSIAGRVTDAISHANLASVVVQVYNSAGTPVKGIATAVDGTFTAAGLSAGSYYLRTFAPGGTNYVDVLYNSIYCLSCSVTTGTPVVVTAGGVTANINFALTQGGTITGRIADAGTNANLASVQVTVYSPSGTSVKNVFSGADGIYTAAGLPPGTYYARTFVASGVNYVDQLYSGQLCLTCAVTSGTPITVNPGATTANVNFALSQGGAISGRVTEAATNAPLMSVTVQIFSAGGSFVKASTPAIDGTYTIYGLPPGTYFAVAFPFNGGPTYVGKLFDTPPCFDCTVTSGTPITVAVGATTGNINFALSLAVPDGYEVDNAAGQSAVLTAGTAQVHTFHVSGDVDWLRFPVVAGQRYTITTGLYSFNVSTRLSLYEADGTTPIGSGFSGLTFTAGSTGLNYLKVQQATVGFGYGSYTVTLDAGPNPLHDVNVSSDFDGDGKSDLAVYRPGSGDWLLRLSSQHFTVGAGNWHFQWGLPGDVPLVGDFDRDGKADPTVYRPSTGEWFILGSSDNYVVGAGNWHFQWGLAGDRPVASDFDGDGQTDMAVFRPATGEWFIRNSSSDYIVGAGNWQFQWGLAGDQPLAADFDGDGKADPAVYRAKTGEWFILNSSQNYVVGAGNWYFQWGLAGDQPLAADFDGDGKADLAVYRPSTGQWFIRNSLQNYIVGAGNWYFQWGLNGDLPRLEDIDGDGKRDPAVYRPNTGEWFLRSSSQGYVVGAGDWHFQWGLVFDTALPN